MCDIFILVQLQISSLTYKLKLKLFFKKSETLKNGRNCTKQVSAFQGNARHQIALTLKEIQQR